MSSQSWRIRNFDTGPGKFIALEGPDGAGKSTVRDFIFHYMESAGYGGFMLGQHSWLDPTISRTIIDFREQRRHHSPDALSDAYYHDKRLHASRTIQPAL